MVDLALLRTIAGIIFAIIGGIVLLCNYLYLYYRIRYKESPSLLIMRQVVATLSEKRNRVHLS